ncbi:SNF2-related protein [Tsukamurella sp. 8F]|uniref:DEAD/DEAH box helicase n=1 Tax=Tsukamurella sp. 8F TaxID=3031961 RepID=UPI0023B8B045|nr:SNF2-related protein [Tsukamurella sp. 8F]MDF0588886.1 SNF2-related protein [Tsukamurella sp. 8F]
MSGPSFDEGDLVPFFGAPTVRRAGEYVANGLIADLEWNAEDKLVTGVVAGTHEYETRVWLTRSGGRWRPVRSLCSCPVSLNCKHGAAILLELTAEDVDDAAPAQVPWERQLEALLPASPRTASTLPVALQFDVDARGTYSAARLSARLVMPGMREGSWVAGDLRWRTVAGNPRLPEAHRDALTGLAQLAMWSVYGADTWVDLTAIDSMMVWDQLERVRDAGVPFLAKAARTTVLLLGPVRLGLVAQPVDGGVELGLETDFGSGPEAFTGGLVGPRRATGLFQADPGRITLAPLASPLSEAHTSALRRFTAIQVPEADLPRLRERYLPFLAGTTPVRDPAATVGEVRVSRPVLVCAAKYFASASELEVAWRWRYTVGDDTRDYPLGSEPAGLADAVGQQRVTRAMLNALKESGVAIDHSKGFYRGTEAALWLAEVAPVLTTVPDLALEVTDDPVFKWAESGATVSLNVDDAGGESMDWFDLEVTVEVDGESVPFRDVFTAVAAGQDTIVTPGGLLTRIDGERFDRLRELIGEARELPTRGRPKARGGAGSFTISRFQAGLVEDIAEIADAASFDEGWSRRVGALAAGEIDRQDPPTKLQAELRPYQRDGLDWLAFLWDNDFGGILADDMGLGKTIQTLALICRAHESGEEPGPFLVVAPTSVVANWAAECARFAPHLSVATVTETVRRSGASVTEMADGADIVLTSYTLLRLDDEEYSTISWAGVVLDEAQFVKNPRSKAFAAVAALDRRFTLAVTGTPMENHLEELWALLALTVPGLFPGRTYFADEYRRPIERGGDDDRLARLRRRIRPFMLRRTKDLVAKDLPEKMEAVVAVDLSDEHRHTYDRILADQRAKLLGLLDDYDGNRFEILRSLTLLRRLALDPSLIDEELAVEQVAKLDYLGEKLDELLEEDHNVLVFSQFTGFLRKAAERLDADGVRYAYLDGSTTDRASVIERFTSGDVRVFLISLKAGGFGLNLVQADYCFLLDPWWNPAAEAQAVDRAHRIGQTRSVMVYRLVSSGTIEDKVMALKERKAALFDSVVGGEGGFDARLAAADIRALLDG